MLCPASACHAPPVLDVPRPIKNPRREALQVSIMDAGSAFDAVHFREGQATCVHRWMLLAELRVVLPGFALCLLTRFRREHLLGET
jgi:hypothetical protein